MSSVAGNPSTNSAPSWWRRSCTERYSDWLYAKRAAAVTDVRPFVPQPLLISHEFGARHRGVVSGQPGGRTCCPDRTPRLQLAGRPDDPPDHVEAQHSRQAEADD